MTISPRLIAGLAAFAAIAFVIAANWQFVSLATGTHPGCVPVDTDKPAAKASC